MKTQSLECITSRTDWGRRRLGFTLLELMITIGIIALLAAILLPAANAIRERARRVVCLSNERQLTHAWLAYASHNGDRLVSANTNATSWVNANNVVADITGGLLYPHVRDWRVYKCPSDAEGNLARSYSINCMLNGEPWDGKPHKRITEVPRPAETFVFIEEHDPRGYDQGSFALYPFHDAAHPDQWVDMPGVYHGSGTCLSFVDGHAEYWLWSDPRTLSLKNFFAVTPNNPDLYQLQAARGD